MFIYELIFCLQIVDVENGEMSLQRMLGVYLDRNTVIKLHIDSD